MTDGSDGDVQGPAQGQPRVPVSLHVPSSGTAPHGSRTAQHSPVHPSTSLYIPAHPSTAQHIPAQPHCRWSQPSAVHAGGSHHRHT